MCLVSIMSGLYYVAGIVGARFCQSRSPNRMKANDQMSMLLGVSVARDTGLITNSIIGGVSEFSGSFLYSVFVGTVEKKLI